MEAVGENSTASGIDITTSTAMTSRKEKQGTLENNTPSTATAPNATESGEGGVYKRSSTEAEISPIPQQAGVIANAPEESKQSTKVSDHSPDSTPSVALKPSLHPCGYFREEDSASAKAASLLFSDGTTMRTPHCLTPVNVLATARPMTYSCEERQLLAARIYQSAESRTTFSREGATTRGTHAPVTSSCVNVSLRVSIAPECPESGSKTSYNGADLNRGAGGEPASKCSGGRLRRIGDHGKGTGKTGANTKQNESSTNESPPDDHDFLAVSANGGMLVRTLYKSVKLKPVQHNAELSD